jgi:hypothetical protein
MPVAAGHTSTQDTGWARGEGPTAATGAAARCKTETRLGPVGQQTAYSCGHSASPNTDRLRLGSVGTKAKDRPRYHGCMPLQDEARGLEDCSAAPANLSAAITGAVILQGEPWPQALASALPVGPGVPVQVHVGALSGSIHPRHCSAAG